MLCLIFVSNGRETPAVVIFVPLILGPYIRIGSIIMTLLLHLDARFFSVTHLTVR